MWGGTTTRDHPPAREEATTAMTDPRGPMPELPEGIEQQYLRHLDATTMTSGETSAPGPMGTDPAVTAADLIPPSLRGRDVTVLPEGDLRGVANFVRDKLNLPQLPGVLGVSEVPAELAGTEWEDVTPQADDDPGDVARRAASPATGSWLYGTPTSATTSLINDTTAMVHGDGSMQPRPGGPDLSPIAAGEVLPATLQDTDAHAQPGAPLRNPLGVPLDRATATGPYGSKANPDGSVNVKIPVTGPNVPQNAEDLARLAFPDADKSTLSEIANAWRERQRMDELQDLFDSGGWTFTTPMPPPAPWVAPAATELPELRDRLVRHLGRVQFTNNLAQALYNNRGTVNAYPEHPERGAAELIADEQRRLRAAHLLSITAPMTEMAKHAAAKIDNLTVRPNDLPTIKVTNRDGQVRETIAWSGLMVFDTPMATYVQNNGAFPADPISIVAVSWGPTRFGEAEFPRDPNRAPQFDSHGEPVEQDTLWVTYWHATDYDRQTWMHAQSHEFMLSHNLPTKYGNRPMSRKQAAELARQTHAPIDWNNESIIGFGVDMIDHINKRCEELGRGKISPNGEPAEDLLTETHLGWLRVVLATWALTKNHRVSTTRDKPLKPRQEREARKRNYNPSPVRVVHLNHRHSGGTGEHASGYQISVHYLRKGHWRDQPYPSRGADYTERIWIEETLCGDPTKPLSQPKATVTRIDRPPA